MKYFQNFNILDQLHRIIITNDAHLQLQKRPWSANLSDISDGQVHRRLAQLCSDPFITLTVNVDGIQPNQGSNQSIWPIVLVINELPMFRRFSPENVILAGVWPGPSKPSRNEMALFLQPLVDELSYLEAGNDFLVPASDISSSPQMKRIRVFLIGACCDKPAQALIQNIPEPIAAIGCGRCEIEGSRL